MALELEEQGLDEGRPDEGVVVEAGADEEPVLGVVRQSGHALAVAQEQRRLALGVPGELSAKHLVQFCSF